ncbi:hypothetical protein BDQ17DRAFT_1405449 [Cyathus striatus]|nr:hypothetical protein BDQ17DRAFT_1405449 [Cyathus striatus]
MSESRNLPYSNLAKLPLHNSPIPIPSHRHAAPSAPWPWVDISDEVDQTQLDTDLPPVPKDCDHSTCNGVCWMDYPKSRFPNWTERQVRKSKIWDAVHCYDTAKKCTIYHVDVNDKGIFTNADSLVTVNSCPAETWKKFMEPHSFKGLRVRALFLENLSGPVLQMLGAKYNIEPFFFSSSLNWIPSRYQEDIRPGVGDHITISMTYLRSLSRKSTRVDPSMSEAHTEVNTTDSDKASLLEQMIDTKAPLDIRAGDVKRQLILDLLSVHLLRRKEGSVIISYHPSYDTLETTKADYLQKRIRFAGQSVYWQSIFQNSPDPTFVLLTFVWNALYAWDEALENLYTHICRLESEVITTSEMTLTQGLHTIRAHLLHYSSLLEDFRKTVEFIRVTHNPALDAPEVTEEQRNSSKIYMERECSNLLSEIARLEMQRSMQDKRLKNVMGLVFSSVNIIDSKRMQKMTEAAVRDSAALTCSVAMKQIAYLTMIFLPASFVAAVFGMNVKEISPNTKGTLPHYIGTAISLTIVTIWIIIAFQSRYIFPERVTFWKRLGWPVLLFLRFLGKDPYEQNKAEQEASHLLPFASASIKQDMARVRHT